MLNVRYVGVDVHKESMVMAVADSGNAPAERLKRLEWSESQLLKELRGWDRSVPDEHIEALSDLVRVRDDARLAERRIKQQLLKFLLR